VSLLRVEDLSMSFGGVLALSHLDFTIAPGIIHSIIGPNGAGKTTLFNLITGIYKPTGGRIFLEDEDISGKPPYELAGRGLSRIFQNVQVFFNMTALENVMVGHHLHCDRRFLPALLRFPGIVKGDAECREYAAELMAYVGLGDYVRSEASALPYGALKRLEIARALATRPKLLLLDEPAAGLNPTETEAIKQLIHRIAESGITVLLVEHDMRLVMGVSDLILVLDGGRRLASGTAVEIRGNPDVVAAYLGTEGTNR
jgi:branched-chain amino acid transport system ATP-binding protein